MLKEKRGAILEVVVSRMKQIKADLRFIALSATVPNIEDVASWLGRSVHEAQIPARALTFGERYRPVQIEKCVYGYSKPEKMNDFAFDALLTKQVFGIIQKHANAKPTIIFCATRKDALKCAKEVASSFHASDKSAWPVHGHGQINFRDSDLSELAALGVAFHHAGLDMADRTTVERLFLDGTIHVITATSTLAVGVNLPAHLVIIKNTLAYVGGSFEEYSDLEVLQMIGRAGRPQFDNSGTAVILTEKDKVPTYENLVSGTERLESYLHENLLEHINAEIGLGTFKDVYGAIQWLKSTFLYVRARHNPAHYNMESTDLSLEEHLAALCEKDICLLKENSLITSSGGNIKITAFGDAMAKYYVRYETMCNILAVPAQATSEAILIAVCKAEEFLAHRFRPGEKPFYNELKRNSALRFTYGGKTEEIWQKIMLLSQLDMCSIDVNLMKDRYKDVLNNVSMHKASIRLQLLRFLSCIIDCNLDNEDAITVYNALELRRSIAARCWEGHPSMLKQLTGIGEGSLKTLLANDIDSFASLRITDPRELERIFKRNPPFGNGILKDLDSFPRFKMHVTFTKSHANSQGIEVSFCIRLLAENQPRTKKGGHPHHVIFLVDTPAGTLLDFRRQSINRIVNGVDLPLKIQLRTHTTGIRFRLMCEELVGNLVEYFHDLALDYSSFQSAEHIPGSQALPSSSIRPQSIESETGTLCEIEDDAYIDIFEEDTPDDHNRTNECVQALLPTKQPKKTLQPQTAGQSTSVGLIDGRCACNHSCKDKLKCGHLCCKDGVARKKLTNKDSTLETGHLSIQRTQIPDASSAWCRPVSAIMDSKLVTASGLEEANASPLQRRTPAWPKWQTTSRSDLMVIDLSCQASRPEDPVPAHAMQINLERDAGDHQEVGHGVEKSRTHRTLIETSEQEEMLTLSDIIHRGHADPSATSDSNDEYGWNDGKLDEVQGVIMPMNDEIGSGNEGLTSALFLPTSPETPRINEKHHCSSTPWQLSLNVVHPESENRTCAARPRSSVTSAPQSVDPVDNSQAAKSDFNALAFLGDCFVIDNSLEEQTSFPHADKMYGTLSPVVPSVSTQDYTKLSNGLHESHLKRPSDPASGTAQHSRSEITAVPFCSYDKDTSATDDSAIANKHQETFQNLFKRTKW